MEDDFDLEGLSPEEARAYVARFVQSLLITRRQREEQEAEYEKWKSRTRFATERGEDDLAREALRKAEELLSSLSVIRKDERELDFKVTELKRRLANVESTPQRSVDADALLERLQSVAGTDQPTNDAIADAEAELALEELRRKMRAEGDGTEGDNA